MDRQTLGSDMTLEKNLWAGLDNNVINLVQSQADERYQIKIRRVEIIAW